MMSLSKKVVFILKEMKMESLGVMYLLSALKKAGHKVALITLDNIINLPNINPNFICYSVCSGSEEYYFNLDNYIRTVFPHIHYQAIFGGPAVTFNPEKFKNRIFIRGEAEKALVDLINGQTYEHLQAVDINSIPPPDRYQIYQYPKMLANPIKNMITRRGCPFACSYCFNRTWNELHKNRNPIIRLRNVKDVIDEALELKEKWQPLKMIHIMDDGFAKPIAWLREFAPLYREKVNVPFICNINPKDISEEVLELLVQANCAIISLALESANDENRTKILNRTTDKETVKTAVQLCHKYKIRTRLQNIIGLPVKEPLKDALETLDYNIECNPTSSWCAILQCYKGTKIFDIAKETGYIPDDESVDEGFFGVSTLKIKDRKKIERLHKLWTLITTYPRFLRPLTPFLIKIPLPFSFYQWIFQITKKHITERNLWKVYK